MTDKQMAKLAALYKKWAEIIVKAWVQDIQGCTLARFIFEVEMHYPGCILATREVKRRLEQMGIPIYAVYVSKESKAILIEIMADKEMAEKLNRKLKKEIPVSGWLVVEREHRDDGTEEERSKVETIE